MLVYFAMFPYLSFFLLPSVMRTASPKFMPEKEPKIWKHCKIVIMPYTACCLDTICLLSNNLSDKKHIVQCNLMLIYSQLKTGKL